MYNIELLEHKKGAEGTTLSVFKRPDGFDYLPGQHVVLRFMNIKTGDAETGMRTFTIASSPTEENIIIAYRNGISEFKKVLQGMKKGDTVKMFSPVGRFVLPEDKSSIVMIAGGIGIVPFRVFMKYSIDNDLGHDFVLFYSNPTANRITYKEEFDEFLKNSRTEKTNNNIQIVNTLTKSAPDGWREEKGRINSRMIKDRINDVSGRLFYVCGPVDMVKDMEVLLIDEMGVDEKNIKTEKFTGY